MSSARRAFIGDMVVVRASQDMEPGTEITFWYKSPEAVRATELDKKFKNWGFICGCAMCLDARAMDAAVFTRRDKLIGDLKRAFNSPAPRYVKFEKIERLFDALNKTYTQAAENVPRILLWDPLLGLLRAYAEQSRVGKIMESAVKFLTSLGFVVVGADSSETRFTIIKWGVLFDHVVELFLHVRNAFLAMGAKEDSERAKEYAKTTYKVLVGEDVSFDVTYSEWKL